MEESGHIESSCPAFYAYFGAVRAAFPGGNRTGSPKFGLGSPSRGAMI
jgi:hypothetical protein